MSKSLGIAIGAVAAVIAIVAIILTTSYRNQELQVTRQLQQVERAQQAAAKTANQASTARLGLCWSSTQDSSTFDVQSLQIDSPVLTNGVYACPSGETFVSVVPNAGS